MNEYNVRINLEAMLKQAVLGGHLNTVKQLVLDGANIHFQNDLVLQIASSWGRLGIVEFLLSQGGIPKKNIKKAIIEAYKKREDQIVNYLETYLFTRD